MDPDEVQRVTDETIEKYVRYVNPTAVALLKLGGFDKIEWEGCGATIKDIAGNEYVDCLGGYGVFSLGHAHPRVVEAVTQQIKRLPLSSKTFLNKPLADLAELLASVAPGKLQYTFMCNSGTEAVEAALKFARMATNRTQFVSTVGSYHGKTLGALSASGREGYRIPFQPLVPGFVHVPFGDVAAMEKWVGPETAAVILEPVQGENGIRLPPDDYLPAVRALCDERGALLILDEVQTGLGRTGKMFACEHWNVAPDILTLAKALGGGVVPAGAIMATPGVWDQVFHENPFIHTSTFGGSEMACVAGIAAIQTILDEDLPAQAAVKGEKLLAGLKGVQEKYPDLIAEARGLGLMIGVEFRDADVGKLVIGGLVHHGVIAAYTLNNATVMRFEPPLIISDAQIEHVVRAFDAAVGEAREMLAEFM